MRLSSTPHAKVDEVWVPSQFNNRTFTKAGVEPSKLQATVAVSVSPEPGTPSNNNNNNNNKRQCQPRPWNALKLESPLTRRLSTSLSTSTSSLGLPRRSRCRIGANRAATCSPSSSGKSAKDGTCCSGLTWPSSRLRPYHTTTPWLIRGLGMCAGKREHHPLHPVVARSRKHA